MRGPATGALALALLATGPALAQDHGTPLDGAAFEALVAGRTLTYGAEDAPVPRGVETYRPGRRVTWLLIATDDCVEGRWYGAGPPEAPEICFVYDGVEGKQCYRYYVAGTRVTSTNLDGGSPEVSWLDRDTDGIACEWLGS